MAKNKQQQKSFSSRWKDWRRALGFAHAEKKYIVLILFLTFSVAAINSVDPLVLKYIFDLLDQDQMLFTQIVAGVGLLLLLGVVREITAAFSNWLTWRTRISLHYGILSATVEKLHRLPIDYHRQHGVGATMVRLERSVQGFISAISEISFNILPSVFYLILSIIFMLNLDWRMTILTLAFTPLPALIASRAAPEQTRREKFLMDKWGKIYARFNEVLSGLVTVKSFAMEDYEKKRFLRDVNRANKKVIKGVRYDSGLESMQKLTVVCARVAALGFGGWLVYQDTISLGTLIAFLGYIGGLFAPVQGLTGIYKTLNTASVSLDFIFEILDTQDRLGDAPDARDLQKIQGKVDFDHIRFAYTEDSPLILRDVSLHVRAGETIAIVGPSGSGKSTLMALLQRFYDPDQGTVSLDNLDIRLIRQKSLRSNIGVVLQDALLFNESVKNNIAYGRPEATMEDIEQAARHANAHQFIINMEKGYDTSVGEKGSRLSVGERQRIAIARAILKDPPIIILDEATSALDAELEAMVQEALDRLLTDRTAFIIAHRLSTIVGADRIVVFRQGNIVEEGSHQELLQQKGYYALLVEKQTRGLIAV
jgi:ATP-binding cassette subfamily B protein